MRHGLFWLVVGMLAAAALILHTRSQTEVLPEREPLAQLPQAFADWTGANLPIAADEISILGRGEFLSRLYRRGSAAPVGLFIGYFPSQRSGDSIHSPRNCLPGEGWSFESAQYLNLEDGAGKTHQVGEYVLSKGEDRQFAIYWYQAHGRSVANEYRAKFYLVADALRLNRSDGALVRVVTPIDAAGNMLAAKMRAEEFTAQLFPALPRFIPD